MKSSELRRVAILGMAAFLVSCASTSGAQGGQQARAGMGPAGGMMGDMCPARVPGTTVTSADVEGGAALDFRTTKGDVAELRQRVQRMAAMHNQHHASGGMGMMEGRGMGGAGGGMMMPAATASVEDIEGGARLVLRPADPADLKTLRQHTRMHADRMAGVGCPMMSGSRGPAAPAPSPGKPDHEAHHPPPEK